ncbi:hypothetical protein ACIQFZ_12125 [Streptomyces sp. NPDC093064]|uniref:hypothetical protein n=1 Tax=unclassified Streptomyces TaxID=2593676 RepID=UPI003415C63A
MGTETDWVYRVFEPHGSEGWRPYGRDPERWRGTITADDLSEGPQYALSLVVADLMTEWKVRGLHRAKHVRVYLWRDEEGDQEDADAIVEVRPSIHAELPAGDRIRASAGCPGCRFPQVFPRSAKVKGTRRPQQVHGARWKWAGCTSGRPRVVRRDVR